MFRIKTPIEKITCAHVLSSEGGKPQVEKCITSITGDIKAYTHFIIPCSFF